MCSNVTVAACLACNDSCTCCTFGCYGALLHCRSTQQKSMTCAVSTHPYQVCNAFVGQSPEVFHMFAGSSAMLMLDKHLADLRAVAKRPAAPKAPRCRQEQLADKQVSTVPCLQTNVANTSQVTVGKLVYIHLHAQNYLSADFYLCHCNWFTTCTASVPQHVTCAASLLDHL